MVADFTGFHFLQPKTEVTYEEFIQHCEEHYDAKRVPYWKIKNRPKWDEFKEGFDQLGGEPSDDLAAYQAESKRKKYWEDRARQLAATPNITKEDVLTAMSGVTLNSELTALLKEHLKRAK